MKFIIGFPSTKSKFIYIKLVDIGLSKRGVHTVVDHCRQEYAYNYALKRGYMYIARFCCSVSTCTYNYKIL